MYFWQVMKVDFSFFQFVDRRKYQHTNFFLLTVADQTFTLLLYQTIVGEQNSLDIFPVYQIVEIDLLFDRIDTVFTCTQGGSITKTQESRYFIQQFVTQGRIE